MNRARAAAARAKLHEALDELLDALADDDGAPAAAESRPRPKRERRPRTLVRPAGEATPIVAGQAARILRDRGFR